MGLKIGEREHVICDTVDQAKALCDLFHEHGYRWGSGDAYNVGFRIQAGYAYSPIMGSYMMFNASNPGGDFTYITYEAFLQRQKMVDDKPIYPTAKAGDTVIITRGSGAWNKHMDTFIGRKVIVTHVGDSGRVIEFNGSQHWMWSSSFGHWEHLAEYHGRLAPEMHLDTPKKQTRKSIFSPGETVMHEDEGEITLVAIDKDGHWKCTKGYFHRETEMTKIGTKSHSSHDPKPVGFNFRVGDELELIRGGRGIRASLKHNIFIVEDYKAICGKPHYSVIRQEGVTEDGDLRWKNVSEDIFKKVIKDADPFSICPAGGQIIAIDDPVAKIKIVGRVVGNFKHKDGLRTTCDLSQYIVIHEDPTEDRIITRLSNVTIAYEPNKRDWRAVSEDEETHFKHCVSKKKFVPFTDLFPPKRDYIKEYEKRAAESIAGEPVIITSGHKDMLTVINSTGGTVGTVVAGSTGEYTIVPNREEVEFKRPSSKKPRIEVKKRW